MAIQNTRLKFIINEPLANSVSKVLSISNIDNTIDIGPFKILILHNQRVFNLFKTKSLSIDNFEDNYYKYLNYGLVFIFCGSKITIFNDIYGAYPIFTYLTDNGKINTLTNYFEPTSNSNLNKIAVVEFIHFNHFLGTSTLNTEVKRVQGGMKIEISNERIYIKQIFNWENIVQKFTTYPTESLEPYLVLQSVISEAIDKKEATLTLTGGYDSRLLFSILLSQNINFKSLTWGIPGNLQTEIARELSTEYSIKHINILLNDSFKDKINGYVEYILRNYKETPFIIDVPQFIYMCQNLPANSNLICGFMGSEVIRGPSYSSQVTLTKFAAQICLAKNKNEIKNIIINFNERHPFINNAFINKYLDHFVDKYFLYSLGSNRSRLRNYNMFRYLFFEKYAKIYGQFIKIHYDSNINLINPYLDFEFICTVFNRNNTLNKFTPFENNQLKNFFLYRFYAKEIKKAYPGMLLTKVDRGYKIKDLITMHGYFKLIPKQIKRKLIKGNAKTSNKKVVDSFNWYYPLLKYLDPMQMQMFEEVINFEYYKKDFSKLSDLDKIKVQLIYGLVNS